MFDRLKDWCHVATRYDQCPTDFFPAIALAATAIFCPMSRDSRMTFRLGWFARIPIILGAKRNPKNVRQSHQCNRGINMFQKFLAAYAVIMNISAFIMMSIILMVAWTIPGAQATTALLFMIAAWMVITGCVATTIRIITKQEFTAIPGYTAQNITETS